MGSLRRDVENRENQQQKLLIIPNLIFMQKIIILIVVDAIDLKCCRD